MEDDESFDKQDTVMPRELKWLMRNLVPVLLISLVIDITVIFIVPMEYTMEWWFRLKDVFSFICAILIFHLPQIIRYICSKF